MRRPRRPDDFRITLGLACTLCWGAHHMGLQDANDYCDVHHRGLIYSPLHELKGGHPHDGDAPGGKGAWSQDGLPATESALHRL